MHRSKRVLLPGIALFAVAALTLVGCGSAGDDEKATDGKTEISFHSWLPTQDHWTDIVAAFEADNPDIKVNFTREEDFDAYKTNLDNEILADDIPDVYGIQVGSAFDDYAEYALPVDDYADGWLSKVNAESLKQTTTSDGLLAAMPVLNAGQEFYLYNKTVFDELGLALPTSYEELLAVATAARAAGYTPFAMGAADSWHDVDFYIWLSNQYGSGGDIYKAAEGDLKWDSENLVSAATQWQKLFTDGVFQDAATTTTTYPAARDDYFLARKSIAFPTGSWHVGAALLTSPEVPGSAVEKDEIGMAVFPTLGTNDAGPTSGVDFALAISADSDKAKQDAAAKFVEFMSVGKGQQLWINTLQGFPVANDMSIEIGDDEPELAKSSVDLVTEALQSAKYPRKLSVAGTDSLENDLGIALQNIAAGADPAAELASLNK